MSHSNQSAGSPGAKSEGPGKTRLVQLMAAFFMIGGVQVATQYFAHRFQYQPQLGVHFVPALTRHRLSWMKQNYIRAETLVRANARLVDYQATLSLARSRMSQA